jgi:hypothetical protein
VSRALVLVLLCSATGCNADDCNSLAGSGPFGAFLVGGSGPYEAHLICDTLPSSAPIQPQALMAKDGLCAPEAGDDACVGCAKAWCCVPVVTCAGERACSCLVACRTSGETLTSCTEPAACGDSDPAYDAAVACVVERCATQCPRFQ